MKKGILRVLGVVVTLALMLTILPASIASANSINTVSILPAYSGKIGDRVYIRAEAPSANGQIINIYFSSQNVAEGKIIDVDVTTYKYMDGWMVNDGVAYTADGLVIPSTLTDGVNNLNTLHGGYYYFYLTLGEGSKIIAKKVTFYLEGLANIEPSVTSGAVGSQVEIEGVKYAKNEILFVKFDGVDITDSIVSGDGATDTNGNFLIRVVIPENLKGVHTISVVGATSLAEDSFEFTIVPSITLSVDSGASGANVVISGYGFNRLKYLDIYITGASGTIKLDDNTATVRSDRTNTLGSFTYSATIPSTLASGNYTISVEEEQNNTVYATAPFQVTLNSVLTISHSTGNVGDTVTVTGTNFNPNSSLNILFDTQTVGTVTTDALGNFSQQITVPAAVCGAHLIKVGTIQQTYTVTPKMSLDKTQGIAGTTVTVTGKGFAGGTAIMAMFDSTSVVITPAVTDATGGFVASFTVPAAATGSHTITITAGNALTANFTIVDAAITLNANSGEVGDTITVTGANFAAGSNITLTIDGVAIPNMGTITAGATGDFTVAFNIPTIAGGPHTIAVSDGTTTKSAQFTVTARASLTPTSGNVGSAVTVSGSGFSASAMLTIKYNGTVVATGTLPVTGAFANATFTVPASPGGARTVEVTDGINTVQLTFAMETTPPPAPTLTLPLQASKEKGIVTFDWSDVTDLSLPVTYTLQVATDSSFSNIFVNVAGLTASTYTLTDAQKLSKLPDNGQYYWRVIATDGASNSSTSSVNTFVVGGGLPSWLMWVWIGIGVVVVFIFAIWLGRRMAYSAY